MNTKNLETIIVKNNREARIYYDIMVDEAYRVEYYQDNVDRCLMAHTYDNPKTAENMAYSYVTQGGLAC